MFPGNTSRRFFANRDLTSEITKIDKDLIHRFAIILGVINSTYDIDPIKFGTYANETAELAIQLYPWYYMPSTIHKILLHGSEIVAAAALPIGMLSEEAQESRNKDYKIFRLNHSRKYSRLSTNEDIFHKILETSDPFISSLRPEPKKKHYPVSSEILDLLI